ncbi:MAG: PAS domain S-box protein, partial [Myxococcota bacterium]|nr:PAS domain S-box protein [Myxococcota bacterium]
DEDGRKHRQLAGSFMHTILEWSAVTAALATGLGTLIHFQVRRNAVITVIGLTILASGVMDGFHILVADRLIGSQAGDPDFVPFTSFISRLFCAASLILGSVLLITRSGRIEESRTNVVIAVSLVMSAAVALSVGFASTTNALVTQAVFPGDIVPRPYDLIPMALFLVARAFVLPTLDRYYPSVFTQALIISVIPHVASQLYMAIGSTEAFDGWYNAAHVVKVIAYLVPGSGLLVEYVRIHREEAAVLTELQESKRSMRRARAMYRTMVRNLPNSIVLLFDPNLESLAAEGAALKWLERTSADFDGEMISTVLPPHAWEKLETPFRQSLKGESSSFTYEGSGRVFEVQVVPLRDADMSISAGMAVFMDITERRDEERSLRLTQFSVDNAADAVMWLNEDGDLLDANEAVSKYLGYSIDELLALSVFDIDPFLMEGDNWTELWREVKGLKSRTIQGRLRKRDSSEIDVESTYSYLSY